MSALAHMTSVTAGHGCWPPTMVTQGSPTVFVGGLPASTMGHMLIPHVCVAFPFPLHPAMIAAGSGTVMIEGAPAARLGDMASCGDMIAVGNPTVLVG